MRFAAERQAQAIDSYCESGRPNHRGLVNSALQIAPEVKCNELLAHINSGREPSAVYTDLVAIGLSRL